MKKASRNSLFLLVLLIQLSIVFRNTFPLPKDKMIQGIDRLSYSYHYQHYIVSTFKKGIIPFWNPHVFSGMPALAHPGISIFYPLNTLFLFVPLNVGFSIFVIGHFTIAYASMYYVARKKFDRISSLAAATVFTFSGFPAARVVIGHDPYLAAYAWMPLVFYTTHRALASGNRKHALVAIILISLQMLTGAPFFVFISLSLALLWIISPMMVERFSLKKMVMLILSFSGLLLSSYGLLAVYHIPAYELFTQSHRSMGLSLNQLSACSFRPTDFILFVYPQALGLGDSFRGPCVYFNEGMYYIGFIAFTLLLLYFPGSMYKIWKSKRLNSFFVFVSIVCILFSLLALGKNLAVYPLLMKLPVLHSFRIPPRFLVALVFASSLVVAEVVSYVRHWTIRGLFVVLIFIELTYHNSVVSPISLVAIPTVADDSKLMQYLEHGTNNRLLDEFVLVNAPMTYGLHSLGGYNALILKDYNTFISLFAEYSEEYPTFLPPIKKNSKALDFLNVEHILLSQPSKDPTGRSVVMQNDQFTLYQNTTVLPRFFLVSKAYVFPSEKEVRQALSLELVNMRDAIALEGNETKVIHRACETDSDQIEIVRYEPNRIVLSIKTACGGYLSSSEVYYPGWVATVDGKRVEILKSNLAFRSILVPKGSSTVEFFYEPTIFVVGLSISLLSAGVLLLWSFGLLPVRLMKKYH